MVAAPGQGPVVERDAGGEDRLGRVNLLELQAGMSRVVGEEAEGLASSFLNLFR